MPILFFWLWFLNIRINFIFLWAMKGMVHYLLGQKIKTVYLKDTESSGFVFFLK
ncbi:hypothetical protein CG09_0476 [Riemerella anatipestifer]|nr:hypothetical protein CG09_0476 [Riemerella anatipestifer]